MIPITLHPTENEKPTVTTMDFPSDFLPITIQWMRPSRIAPPKNCGRARTVPNTSASKIVSVSEQTLQRLLLVERVIFPKLPRLQHLRNSRISPFHLLSEAPNAHQPKHNCHHNDHTFDHRRPFSSRPTTTTRKRRIWGILCPTYRCIIVMGKSLM